MILKDKIPGTDAILKGLVLDALNEIASGLKHKNVYVRQTSAREILDRVLGKPTQRTEVTGADGGSVQFVIRGADPDNL